MFESGFVHTKVSILEDGAWFGRSLVQFWNKWLGKIRFLRISEKNLTLLSGFNIFLENPHKAHSTLLHYGMDAITLRLTLATDDGLHLDGLADYLKLVEYAYRIAESNDRAIESTYFEYLIATPTYCLIKDMIVVIGYFMFAIPFFYVG